MNAALILPELVRGLAADFAQRAALRVDLVRKP